MNKSLFKLIANFPVAASSSQNTKSGVLGSLEADQFWNADKYASPGTEERVYLDSMVRYLNQSRHYWHDEVRKWDGNTSQFSTSGAYFVFRRMHAAVQNYWQILASTRHPLAVEWTYKLAERFLTCLEGPGTGDEPARGGVNSKSPQNDYQVVLYGWTPAGTIESSRISEADPLEDGVGSGGIGELAVILYANRKLDNRYEPMALRLVDYLKNHHFKKWDAYNRNKFGSIYTNFNLTNYIHWFAHPITSTMAANVSIALIESDKSNTMMLQAHPLYQEAKRMWTTWRAHLWNDGNKGMSIVNTPEGEGLIWGQYVLPFDPYPNHENTNFIAFSTYSGETNNHLLWLDFASKGAWFDPADKVRIARGYDFGVLHPDAVAAKGVSEDISGNKRLQPVYQSSGNEFLRADKSFGAAGIMAWSPTDRIKNVVKQYWEDDGSRDEKAGKNTATAFFYSDRYKKGLI